MKKRILALILATAIAAAMTACGNSSEPSGTSQEPEQTEESEPSGKEITVWVEKIFSDDANAAIEARLKQYGTENNVTVHVELIGASSTLQSRRDKTYPILFLPVRPRC